MTPSSGRGDGKGTSLRTALQSFRHRIMAEIFLFGIEKKIWEGLTPQLGAETPRTQGEFVALGEYYISYKKV